MNGEHPAWQRARLALSQGNVNGAVEALREVLANDPQDAGAHAQLALCLLETRRLHAAAHESQLALQLDPHAVLAHLARARVLMAQRKFAGEGSAREHIDRLLAEYPEQDFGWAELGTWHDLQDHLDEARAAFERAREIDPADPEHATALGRIALQQGKVGRAWERAQEALSLSPMSTSAHLLMGRIELQRGEVAKARDHARVAISQDPMDRSALALLVSIKARQSKVLGLWWRWQEWMSRTGSPILFLLGAFLIYRVATIALQQAGHVEGAALVQVIWLAFCVYSWVAPGFFYRALRRELQEVELQENF